MTTTDIAPHPAPAPEQVDCSIARALGVIGDRWTILILRDAFRGIRRFDDFRRDLEIARTAWLAEATSPAELAERERSDFLRYRDRNGRVADFHALRHTFITELVRAGVAPKDAKELARHSTITLTMDRYAHVGIRDTAAAVSRLSLPTSKSPGSNPVARNQSASPLGTYQPTLAGNPSTVPSSRWS